MLFRCPDTATLWPRAVVGWGPLKGCLGNLYPISEDEADMDSRWGRSRTELRDSPISRGCYEVHASCLKMLAIMRQAKQT
jgi:hypothetical protein